MSGVGGWQERTERLLGEDAMQMLSRAHVMVVGVGGVGGAAAEAVVRSGVGRVTFVDGDIFAPSNLNRQLLATVSELGRSKAEAAVRRAREINPGILAEGYGLRVTPQNVGELIARKPDAVIDAIDDVRAKVALVAACAECALILGSCMGAGNRTKPEMLRVGDMSEVRGDPLARIVRRELRKKGIDSLLTVYSLEPPMCPPRDEQGRRTPASCAFVPPVAGFMLAGAVLRRVLRIEGKS